MSHPSSSDPAAGALLSEIPPVNPGDATGGALEPKVGEGDGAEVGPGWLGEREGGSEPLSLCVLGGEQLYEGDDYIVTLVTHDRLRPLANALATITPEFIAERYWAMPDDYQQPKSDEDCQYTWDWFSDLPAFFERAEKAGRHVIFSVDQ